MEEREQYAHRRSRRAVRRRGGDAGAVIVCVRFGLVGLGLLLTLTQTLPTYAIEIMAPGTSTENICSASNSDFEADLKQLADTVTKRTDVPPEFLQRYFAGCT